MVCKKSLYCWKNGPCASDQTRKQIWEDNIKFRESLRCINQSDHYWSFQILKNRCLCLEGEELLFDRPLSRKYRSGSLQKLHQIDCTSITHDFNGLKFRNCFVHCPIHDFSKSTKQQTDTNILTKDNFFNCSKYSLQPLETSSQDKIDYCQRYKNTLTSSNLKPSMKMKFSSQSNLNQLHKNKNLLGRKALYSSCENIPSLIHETKLDSSKVKNQGLSVNKSINCDLKVQSSSNHVEHKTKKEKKVKIKKANKELTAKFPNPNPIVMHQCPPLSRTTKKMLSENKKIPFMTYGCNNNSLDVSSKRTHNVLASKLDVYPNALSAKQQKRDLILKYIQSEKEFQKCIPDFKRKLVNHSSLWYVDPNQKETRGSEKKISKQFLPNMNKMMKTQPNQLTSSSYSGYQKPQVHFC